MVIALYVSVQPPTEDSSRTNEVGQVALEILAYLSRHPQAKDRLEGIAEWWILAQRIEVQTAIVKAAVRSLVEQGFLVIERNGAGDQVYGVNPARIVEIGEAVRRSSRAGSFCHAFELPRATEDASGEPKPEGDPKGEQP